MFRFLTDRYPLIMQRLDEDHVFDNFYLDMNGIIHQCTHPSDSKIAIEDFDQMFAQIFHYTERLYRIVAPKSLMFLAVDGVAPRAKMNQQRSRRFRSAKDAERAMAETIARGDDIPSGRPFDSNCITPGTEFMYELSVRFQDWINRKMSKDVAFQQGCTIIFSGPEVPGEGEHKIVEHIRNWKNTPEYDPSIRHCMYGLDADLMMLGLVSHVPHFTLIREKMKFSRNGRVIPQMRGTSSDADEFQLLEIAMLRDMLFLEFKRGPDVDPLRRPPKSSDEAAISSEPGSSSASSKQVKPFASNSRRIVDDFVFMCMLVGNDFIPNLPHLDIADGAINSMFAVYKRLVPVWGGYLTDRHRLHPDRLELFLAELSQTEMKYFHHRAHVDNVPDYRGQAYRHAYYQSKFNIDIDGENSEEKLHHLRTIYMEGLHWVLQYYHNGVSSWNWFYPGFYAVLATDMVNLRTAKVSFQRGRPFRPLTQLMAVLPPESAQFLPEPMRDLMTNPYSPVVDFYPSEFTVDMNGKRNDWEAVVIVPFIDEKRLLKEVNSIDREREMTDMERKRDETGSAHWFHADDYPHSKEKVHPVRPSKFVLPKRRRTPSSSPPRTSGFARNSGRSREPYIPKGTQSPSRSRPSSESPPRSGPASRGLQNRTAADHDQGMPPRRGISPGENKMPRGGTSGGPGPKDYRKDKPI